MELQVELQMAYGETKHKTSTLECKDSCLLGHYCTSDMASAD